MDVRGGRPTSEDMVREFQERYRAIGGGSPLLQRSTEQAEALSASLDGMPVYLGMRHWHPYIRDVFEDIRGDGISRVVALALAPHFSNMSIGAYEKRIDDARGDVETTMVREWYDHPLFLDAVAERVEQGLKRFSSPDRPVPVLFTAHSLPQRILQSGDPYVEHLQASVAGVMERLGDREHKFAFQSAGQSGGPWLGPDAGETIRAMAEEGCENLLVCPIGFVSDHLEVLYDVDIEYRGLARTLGMHLERTQSLNSSRLLIEALADLVRTQSRNAGWTA